MKKSVVLMLMLAFTVSLCGCLAAVQNPQETDAHRKTTEETQEDQLLDNTSAEICDITEEPPIVAIAWTPVEPKNVIAAFKQAGAEVVFLPQVVYNDFSYDDEKILSQSHLSASGMLNVNDAERLKSDWKNSNVSDVIEEATLIVFTGGKDISPSLYRVPEEEKNAQEPFNATRDVSDYILMQYCLELDLPVFGICRGMQLMAIASGASMIQDLPTYYSEHGKDYDEFHRMRKVPKRDYVPHDIDITDRSSLIYAAAQADCIFDAPSWHHQAVTGVESTNLKVTASATYDGLEIIEGIERTDRKFAVGVQYHPEIAIIRHNEGVTDRFTDAQSTVTFLKNLIQMAEERR